MLTIPTLDVDAVRREVHHIAHRFGCAARCEPSPHGTVLHVLLWRGAASASATVALPATRRTVQEAIEGPASRIAASVQGG